MALRYTATIEWIHRTSPTECYDGTPKTEEERENWTAGYLLQLKHFDALEEHLCVSNRRRAHDGQD